MSSNTFDLAPASIGMVALPSTLLIETAELLSTINSLTVDVPFECVVSITSFLNPPIGPFTNVRDEFDFAVSRPLGTGFPEKDQLMSTDISEFHQESTEFFNEQVFCELIRADITEWNEALNRVPLLGIMIAEEGTFTEVSQKMILDLTVKILQNQQVKGVKVSVVLQELSAQIPMRARIAFPAGQNVLEIKTIKNRTKITQCRLIQPKVGTTSKLFIAGFVRKNIQYAANPTPVVPACTTPDITLTVPLTINCSADITGTVSCSGVSVSGATVNFTTSVGTGAVKFFPNPAVTDVNGTFTATLTAAQGTSGTVNITASATVNGVQVSTMSSTNLNCGSPCPLLASQKFFSRVSSGTVVGNDLVIPAVTFTDDDGNNITAFPSVFHYYNLFINGMIQPNGVVFVSPSQILISGGAVLDSDDPIALEFVVNV
ncbi:DUF4183 domain-containing protein [Aneurinibacillus sp. Ricciae_BoGa-3]|uniref:DUF4183 domain-containing protein n=1 Tax=Aneurinibacillus sp. Ricciae_BoGa-3 TaxID=3022697 RepID=UPI00234273FB|nr:DUF4183 domain-containing protein [Aneurinibacillus sp. Ricciae_BoGa-3]WCK55922.1 DUF4183 domain-containing protein [Aneurinibacillus sp. Ricciae_BoGa-3]